jgi:hypothetical protein
MLIIGCLIKDSGQGIRHNGLRKETRPRIMALRGFDRVSPDAVNRRSCYQLEVWSSVCILLSVWELALLWVLGLRPRGFTPLGRAARDGRP